MATKGRAASINIRYLFFRKIGYSGTILLTRFAFVGIFISSLRKPPTAPSAVLGRFMKHQRYVRVIRLNPLSPSSLLPTSLSRMKTMKEAIDRKSGRERALLRDRRTHELPLKNL